MSPSDPSPPADRRQPSLIDTPGAESAAARRAPSLRMLEGLDETTTARAGKAPNSGFQSTQAVSGFGATRADAPVVRNGKTGWTIVTALALVVLAVLWWWTQGREGDAGGDEATARTVSSPPVTAAVMSPASDGRTSTNAGVANPDVSGESPPATTAGAALSAASDVAAAVAAEPARIETVREAAVAVSPTPSVNARSQSGTMTPASVAVGASTSTRAMATAAAVGPTVAARPTAAPTSIAAAAIPPAALSRSTSPSPTPPRSPSPSGALPTTGPVPTAGAAPTEPPATVAAAPAARKTEGAKPSSNDADVTLIDALLARIGANGGTATRAEPNAAPKPALGDLIERCESRAGKETPEAATCRPRICADQWGKSDACPAALAPKR